jgi:hypothetical protein
LSGVTQWRWNLIFGGKKMSEEKRAFKGVWVCASIWLSPDLSWIEKALLAEIDSLVSEESPCYASPERLARRVGVSESRMNHMLAELQNKEYLIKIGSNGRTTHRVVDSNYSSNPKTAARWIKRSVKQELKVAENSKQVLLKTATQSCHKQQNRFVGNSKTELSEIAEQSCQNQQSSIARNSTPIYKEKLRRETQKRIPNDDEEEFCTGKEPEMSNRELSSRRRSTDVVGEKDSTSAMMKNLAREFGLSSKQQKEVESYCNLQGKEYVDSKVRVVQSQPRRNAAGALLSALRDDWQLAVKCNGSKSDDRQSTKPAEPKIRSDLQQQAKEEGWKW